jgi:hypothetical protein
MATMKDEGDGARLVALVTQRRTWRFTDQVAKFERPQILLEPPMEITLAMLRGLRMVDETVVVRGHAPTTSASKTQKGGR